jgi:hypothetical protein
MDLGNAKRLKNPKIVLDILPWHVYFLSSTEKDSLCLPFYADC